MGAKGSKSKELTPGKQLLTLEDLKESKRNLAKIGRKIGRERAKLEREEAKAKKEVAALAKKGKHVSSFSFQGSCKDCGKGHCTCLKADRTDLFHSVIVKVNGVQYNFSDDYERNWRTDGNICRNSCVS